VGAGIGASYSPRARRGKAARHQPVEDEAIGLSHDARRAHPPPRAARHQFIGLLEIGFGKLDNLGAGFA